MGRGVGNLVVGHVVSSAFGGYQALFYRASVSSAVRGVGVCSAAFV